MRGSELWTAFVREFLAEVRERPNAQVQLAWSSKAERTKFYGVLPQFREDGVVPAVGRRLQMEFRSGYMLLDGCFNGAGGWPQVFVEVENELWGIENEIKKLCCVRSPLKLLIAASPWPNADLRDMWLRDIREAAQWLSESPEAAYGLIVGQRLARLTAEGKCQLYYHVLLASSVGEILEPERREFAAEFPPGITA